MKILIIGGDLRYAYLTKMASDRSMEAAAIGLERAPFPLPPARLDDIPLAQAVILPNPWRNGLSLPLTESHFTHEEVFQRLDSNAFVMVPDTSGMPAGLSSRFRIVDLSMRADFLNRNAGLTAEAALCRAMHAAGRAPGDSMCLIIGYGRIGQRLARLLKSSGAQTAVVVRREEARREAGQNGVSAFLMEDLPALLPRAHFIFSTPPARILSDSLLRLISPDALVMDLASPPFGFDLESAQTLGLRAVRESGLPGRCCPLSAARILLDAVLEALDDLQKEDAIHESARS